MSIEEDLNGAAETRGNDGGGGQADQAPVPSPVTLVADQS